LGYSGELAELAKEVPWLTYLPTISRPWEDKEWKGETGRVDDVIRKYAAIWNLRPENTKIYLCGHPGMIENATGIARRAGWPQDAIQSEAFFVIRDEVEATGARG
jgi:ferredoxin--NADP+ reductase